MVAPDGLPQATGAFHVTWYLEDGTAVDSAWLSREEYREFCDYLRFCGFDHTVEYDHRAILEHDKVAKLIQEL